MMSEEIISLLRLQAIPNIGEVSARRLIHKCGSAEAIFREKREALHKIGGIGRVSTRHLFDYRFLKMAEREYLYARDHHIEIVLFQDEKYPSYLRHCTDAPLLLFARGRISLLGQRIISIVGTRQMTRQGEDFCLKFMKELLPLNPVIVSGFAYGVDICVHKAAIELGLQTIGCLAHGLNQIYPRAHYKYCEVMESNGGFLTEFWSTSKPERVNFLKRNRIIAGMSQATVVIESGERGGSLVTADLANDYNREVFAVPGRPGDVYSEGTNRLIKSQKAHLLTTAADLVYHLNWDMEENPSPGVQKKFFVEMNEAEQQVYSHLQEDGKQMLDDIAIKSGISVSGTASVLLSLEMKGVVRRLPGRFFEVT